jgi:hypothetical protein
VPQSQRTFHLRGLDPLGVANRGASESTASRPNR